jgi:amino acid adenylation domain-containing protein
MNDLMADFANLTPEKRALLTLMLQQKAATRAPSVTIPRRGPQDEQPLSFAQERLWFLSQMEPESPAYNIPIAMRMKGALDIAALERSFREVVRRHEVLRTTFKNVGGETVQIINPFEGFRISVIDLDELSAEQRDEEVASRIKEESHRPFDLERDSLLRIMLMRIGEREHVLQMTIHHIISDGWSAQILIKEVTSLYEAFSNHRPSPLKDLRIQYADFALWQRSWLKREVLDSQLTFWKKQLAGAPPMLELRTDKARPAVQTYRGATESLALDGGLSEQIKALSKQEGATLFMTLLAGFKILLHRYTGQTDMVVGTPIANRNRAELEDQIGFFVNALVLRTDLSGDPTFRQLLKRVREVSLEAFAHQDIPFERVVEHMQPDRDMSRSPLFQVMFEFLSSPKQEHALTGLEITPLTVEYTAAKFDLTLTMAERGKAIVQTLEYNTDLFEAGTVARMLHHMERILASIAANPDQRISEIEMLGEAERNTLLVEWNDTERAYPADRLVHELIEDQVKRAPDAIAVISEQEELTYGELSARANQLAHHLRGLQVSPDRIVGIAMHRSVDMIVAMLAALKAGVAYVPIDPSLPTERLTYLLDDTQCEVVLTHSELRSVLPGRAMQVICLDTDWPIISRHDRGNLRNVATSKNLAYVMYTSGSTGKPKGVATEHSALNWLIWNLDIASINSTDVVAQASNPSFDAIVFEVWGALVNGATLVIVEKDTLLSGEELAAQIRDKGISVLYLTAALFTQVASREPKAFSTMRLVLCGGEAIDAKWAEKVLEAGGPSILIHEYGPTETTVFSSFYLIEETGREAKSLPVGRILNNTKGYVVDDRFEPVPVGVIGELYIGGDGLARGYLNAPSQTAERFVPNPYGTKGGEQLYRTGDLVRYLPNGEIEFAGRKDHQVKVRGYRIELAEIEEALGQHAEIVEAVVVVDEDESGEKRLVSYLIPAADSTLSISDLRSFLKQKLPDYMIPSVFVMLEEIPLTPNGKVDRRALPRPNQARPELNQSYVAPRTPIEKTLVGIWQEVLEVEQVGINDNFFELGGHSLKATQLVSRVRDAFQIELPLRSMFRTPTPGELAVTIIQSQAEQTESDEIALLLAELEQLPENEAATLLGD